MVLHSKAGSELTDARVEVHRSLLTSPALPQSPSEPTSAPRQQEQPLPHGWAQATDYAKGNMPYYYEPTLAPRQQEQPLPHGWAQATDYARGNTPYYYIVGTMHRQWEKPASRQPCGDITHKKDAIYAAMLARINARGLGWSRATWEGQFGELSENSVFGDRLWEGFRSFLQQDYLPVARGYVTSFALEDWIPCLYHAPLNFSKAYAALPKSTATQACKTG